MANERVRDALAGILKRFGGRAAGSWRVEGDRLVLVAFEPAVDLPPEVARGFEQATRTVDLASTNLGIVQAATTGRVAISIADGLPAGAGSGHWLRAFGAARSVAVPIRDREGRVEAVVSIALGLEPSDEVVESAVRDLGRP